MAAAGLGAGQGRGRDGARCGGECDIFEVAAGLENTWRRGVEFLRQPLEAVAVADHRRVARHRTLQVGPRQGATHGLLRQRRMARPGINGVRRGRLPCPAADDQALQKAVGRQPVCTMQAGAGHLTGREKARQIGAAVHVGHHAAAAVVRARHHRNRFARRIDAGGTARRRHRREPPLEAIDAACVEIHTRIAGQGQPRVDRGRHHVARCEVAHRMHSGCHRMPLPINENRALTADGFGDQWAPAARITVVQHGRVELDELEIADRHARPHRQRDAVARRTLRVRGRGVQMTQSPGRQDHRRRVHDTEPVVVEHEHTRHRAVSLKQLQRNVIAPDVQSSRGGVERPLHLRARRVATGMDDATPRMSALTGQRPLSRGGFVEPRSVVDQCGHRAIAVGHDRAHRIRITQPGTRGHRVGDMLVDRVFGVRQHNGDAALRIEGRGIVGLAQHHHFSATAVRRQRGDEARNPGADDNDVGTLPAKDLVIRRRRAYRSRSSAARWRARAGQSRDRRRPRRRRPPGSAAMRQA